MSGIAPTATAPRLVPSPVFILSSIRSGSTLLRCVLDTHSLVHAPHELHLADLRVDPAPLSRQALAALRVEPSEATARLWDAVLHRLLTAAGKRHIVDKTPGNLLLWRELAACWPEARFLFLLRHPADVLASAVRSKPADHPVEPTGLVTTYLRLLAEARDALPGLTVRYEDLTADPAGTTARICAHLGVPWEPEMCDYGRAEHGPYEFGIGDFGDRIRSGRIQPGRGGSHLDLLTPELRELAGRLGYGDAA